jgi:ADP-ribose pyrophosphatase YjhB (NUDIX family)
VNSSDPQVDSSDAQVDGSAAQADGSDPQADGSDPQADGSDPQADGSAAQADGSAAQAGSSAAQVDGSAAQADGSDAQVDRSDAQVDRSDAQAGSSAANSAADEVRRIVIALSALSQNGMTYGADEYDLDRYQQTGRLAAELLAVISGRPAPELAIELGRDSGYATPKVDVRGVVFDDEEQVLLMRERADGLWSVPGGWADPGESPSAAVVREVLEETGYGSSAVKLIACWDRELHNNPPPLPVHVYKLFFLCRRNGTLQPPEALETLDVGWFPLNTLPPLSLGRVNHRQLTRALAHHRTPTLPTEFD